MPRAKAVANLPETAASDKDDDTPAMEPDALTTPDSNQENAPVKKRGGRGKASTKRFTKPRTTRRSSDKLELTTAAAKPKAGRKRAPLKETTNEKNVKETEKVDDLEAQPDEDTAMDELVAAKQPVKRKASNAKAGRPAKRAAVASTSETKKDGEFEYTPTTARQTKEVTRGPGRKAQNSGKSQAPAEPEKMIPETQIPKDNEASDDLNDDENEDAVPQSVFRKTNDAGKTNQQRQALIPARRAGSASDTERSSNDASTRRRLGEMTRKFENLETKFRNLKEVGVKEAEARLSEYKTQNEAKGKGMVITTLCIYSP